MVHHISLLQGIILGAAQGIAEPFPVSSLGHEVILPGLFGWNIHQNSDSFLSFLVATHLATAVVLVAVFWSDWVRIVRGLLRSIRDREVGADDTDARLGWLLVVGTIPAAILGLVLEHPLRNLFASRTSAAAFLIVNGILLLAFERGRRRAPARSSDADPVRSDVAISRTLSLRQATAIGTAQAAALIPGISRSGVTMGGGLLAGLSNEDAARYGFLLATPVIGLAAIYQLPHLVGSQGDGVRGAALAGGLVAAATTWLAVRFLLRFFQTNRLSPFGIYCIAAGIACVIAFTV